jgi:hypothetical protein
VRIQNPAGRASYFTLDEGWLAIAEDAPTRNAAE